MEFKGWFTRVDADYHTDQPFDFVNTKIQRRMTLYAQYGMPDRTIQFFGNGATGGAMQDQTVEMFESFYLTQNSYTKDGYTFKGWNTKADGTGISYADSSEVKDGIKDDINLFAQWTLNDDFSVSYELAGGIGNVPTKTNVKWTDTHLIPTESIKKEGYEIDSWVIKDSGIPVSNSSSYADLVGYDVTKKNVTLIPNWVTFKTIIHYDSNNVNATKIADKEVLWDKEVPLDELPSDGGKYVKGWILKGDTTNTIIQPHTLISTLNKAQQKEITLQALWADTTYTVTFDTDQGSLVPDKKGLSWTDKVLAGVQPPTRDESEFLYWIVKNTDIKVDGTTDYASLAKNSNVRSITLQAIYKSTITYPLNVFTKDVIDGYPDYKSEIQIGKADKVLDVLNADASLQVPDKKVTWYQITGNGDTSTTHKITANQTIEDLANAFGVDLYNVCVVGVYEDVSNTLVLMNGNDVIYTHTGVASDAVIGTNYQEQPEPGTLTFPIQGDADLLAATEQNPVAITILNTDYHLEVYAYIDRVFIAPCRLVSSTGDIKLQIDNMFDSYGRVLTFQDIDLDLNNPGQVTLVRNYVATPEEPEVPTTPKYDVKFYNSESDLQANKELSKSTGIEWEGEVSLPLVPNPQDGSIFVGWMEATSKTRVANSNDLKKKLSDMANNDKNNLVDGNTVKVIAQYMPLSYSVMYDLNEGEITPSLNDRNDVKWKEKGLIPTQNPTREGYVFNGWKANGVDITVQDPTYADLVGNDLSIKNVTIQAQWIVKDDYIVIYKTDPNGKYEDIDKNVKWNDKVVPSDDSFGVNGYKVTGWVVEGTGKEVLPGTQYADVVDRNENTPSVTLIAKLIETNYEVKYYNSHEDYQNNTDNGDLGESGFAFTKTGLITKTPPAKPGFSFDGWLVNNSGQPLTTDISYEELVGYDPNMTSVPLVAKWTELSDYTVKYVINKSSQTVNDLVNVKWTQNQLVPNNKETGYDVIWYIDGDVNKTPVTSAMTYGDLVKNVDTEKEVTLVAEWTAQPFYLNVEEDPSLNKQYAWDEDIVAPKPKDIKGSTFVDWTIKGTTTKYTTEQLNAMKFSGLTGNVNDSTITLVANRTENNYQVSYNLQDSSLAEIPTKTNVKWNDNINIVSTDVPHRNGYTFKHWLYEGVNGSVVIDANTTYASLVTDDTVASIELKAIWEQNKYYITFKDGDNQLSREEATWDSELTFPEADKVEGYDIVGWDEEKTSKTIPLADTLKNLKYSGIASDDQMHELIFTVKRVEKNTFTVKYDANRAGISNPSDKTDVKWTDSNLLPPRLSQVGYQFLGWTYNSENVTDLMSYGSLAKNDTVTEITLIGQWKEIQYKILVDQGISPQEIIYTWDQTVAEPTLTPVKGSTFTGWKVVETDTTYTSDELITKTYGEISTDSNRESITLIPVWTQNDYQVSYDLQDNTLIPIDTKNDVKWNDKVNIVSDNIPHRDGYTFDHWDYNGKVVDADTSYADLAIDDTVKSIELKAVWTENTYNVTFKDGDIELLPTQQVKWDDVLKFATNYDKIQGYDVVGWDIEGTTTTISIMDTTLGRKYSEIAKDDTINHLVFNVKRVEKHNYTVKYDINTTDLTNPNDRTQVTWTQKDLLPTGTFVRDGYTLLGWTSNDNLITNETSYGSLTNNDDTVNEITLKAKWESIQYKIIVEQGNTSEEIAYTWDQNVTEPRLTPVKGSTFTGWKVVETNTTYTSDELITKTYGDIAKDAIETSLTLRPVWTPNNYQVSYDLQDTNLTPIDAKTDVKWNDKVNIDSVDVPHRDGYTFKHWIYKAANGNIEIDENTTYASLVTDDKVASIQLIAVWDSVEYNITFKDGDKVLKNQDVNWKTELTFPIADKVEGYDIVGWDVSGTATMIPIADTTGKNYSDIAKVDTVKQLVLTVNRVEKDKFTVKYDANGNGVNAPGDMTNVKWTDRVILPQDLLQVGFQFLGWTYNDELVIDSATYGSLVKKDTVTEITLKAQWKEIQYKMIVNQGNDSQEIVYTWDEKVVKPTLVPVKGSTFTGWKVVETNTTYTSDELITKTYGEISTDSNKESITLIPVWTPNNYQVSYNLQDHTLTPIDTKTDVKWHDLVNIVSDNIPHRDGYTFDHWDYNGKVINADTSYADLAIDDAITNIELKAIWKENTYDVTFKDGEKELAVLKGVAYTDSVTFPTIPTQDGYIFKQWRVKESQKVFKKTETESKTLKDLIDKDDYKTIEVNVEWTERDNFVVKYDYSMSNVPSTIPLEKTGVKWTQKDLLPTTLPTQKGKTISRWIYSVNDSTILNVMSYGDIVDNDSINEITLKAIWTDNAYDVHYQTNNGESINSLNDITWQDTVLLPRLNRLGYDFDGWKVRETNQTFKNLDTKSYQELSEDDDTLAELHLDGQWIEKEGYSVVFNLQGGSSPSIPDTSHLKWTDDVNLPTPPIKAGYTFNGWYLETSGQEVAKKETYAKLAGKNDDNQKALVIKAKWVENSTYTVEYDLDEGTGIHNIQNVLWTQKNLLPSETQVSKGGYVLDYWIDSLGNRLTDQTTYQDLATDDTILKVTIKAVWKETDYKVIYRDENKIINEIDHVQWNDELSLPILKNPGYDFEGWYILKTEDKINNGQKYKDIANNGNQKEIVMTTKWKEKNNFIIYYDQSNGQGLDELTQVYWTQSGFTNKLPLKDGYQFKGWIHKETGEMIKGTDSYAALVNGDDSLSSVTLVALWEKDVVIPQPSLPEKPTPPDKPTIPDTEQKPSKPNDTTSSDNTDNPKEDNDVTEEDKDIVLPDDAIKNPDGTISIPPNSSITVGGKDVTLSGGGTVNKDGTITIPSSSQITINGNNITLSDGGTINKDGTISIPLGSVIIDGKEVKFPNGGVINPDGTYKLNKESGFLLQDTVLPLWITVYVGGYVLLSRKKKEEE